MFNHRLLKFKMYLNIQLDRFKKNIMTIRYKILIPKIKNLVNKCNAVRQKIQAYQRLKNFIRIHLKIEKSSIEIE